MTARGDNLSLEHVYLQYIKPVRIVAYGILKNESDAEDVAHDVFLTYFQMKEPERIRDPKNYLLKMARNKALEYMRRREHEVLTDDFTTFTSSPADGSEASLVARVGCEIAKLPIVERQVFLMHVNAKMGFGEISRVMELSVPAVYRRYRKALKILQQALKGSKNYE